MARKATAGEESTSAYFRRIFREDPKLLRPGSNRGVIERWLRDHPSDRDMPQKAKYIMFNVKALVRKGRKKRKSMAEGDPSASTVLAFRTTASKKGLNALAQLEEAIDGCLATARMIDTVGLADVIHELRSARNSVIRKAGQ